MTDKTTGVGADALKKILAGIVAEGKASGESWRITKAKCFAAQALEMSIDVSPLDWFPAISIWNRHDCPIYGARGGRHGEMNAKLPAWVMKEWHEGNRDGTWNMWQDFDHSLPDWRVILKLGFPGMKARLEKYAVKGDPFYEGLKIAMDAMLAANRQFSARFACGSLVAVAGVSIVSFDGMHEFSFSPFGTALAIAAMFSWAVYSVLLELANAQPFSSIEAARNAARAMQKPIVVIVELLK